MTDQSKRLYEIEAGCFAYLQPDGSWGYSNAGLVQSASGESMLVDTLFDLPLTQTMLETMAPLTEKEPIRTLINTHANGDHCWGNQLVEGADIIASQACAEEISEFDPGNLHKLLSSDHSDETTRYLRDMLGPFDFTGIQVTPPTHTFEGALSIRPGGRPVDLYEVGPAHTRGDLIVHVPDAGVVYTGDIIFVDSTPVVWAGPFSNWIAACDTILALDARVVVPGHGVVTDDNGVRSVREYLVFLDEQASACFEAGLDVVDAACEIAKRGYSTWLDRERVVVNVHTKYREMGYVAGGENEALDLMALVKKKLL